MIHLTDKIYLEYAEASINPEALERRGEDYVQVVDKGLAHIETSKIHSAKRLLYVKSFEELIEHYGTEQKMFHTLIKHRKNANTDKVFIYADEEAMPKILCGFWKGLFNHLDVDAAYSLYLNYGESEKIRVSRKWRGSFFNMKGGGNVQKRLDVLSLYWDMSKEEFSELFHNTKAFYLQSEVKEDCSLEFHIMNHMMGNKLHKRVLARKMNKIFIKKLIREICEIKREGEIYIYDLAEFILKKEAKGNKLNAESLIKEISERPIGKFILDEDISEDSQGFENLKRKYNASMILSEVLKLGEEISRRRGFKDEADKEYPYLTTFTQKGVPFYGDLCDHIVEGINQYELIKEPVMNGIMNPHIIPAAKDLSEFELSKYKFL